MEHLVGQIGNPHVRRLFESLLQTHVAPAALVRVSHPAVVKLHLPGGHDDRRIAMAFF